ncbi:MAG: TPM domain-containing protein [Rhodospirillaceae bacterium]
MRLLAAVLVLFWAVAAPAAEITFPPLTGRVVDQAQVLSAQTERTLEEHLAAHERATHQQVVVATVPSLQGLAIAEYGYQLGRAWGIGEKDKNTGAILLVAPTEREVRIEVGYGLEGTLTDAASRVIIERQILPEFRAGRMENGILRGADAILATLRGDAPAPSARGLPDRHEDPGSIPPIGLIFIIFIILILLSRRGGRSFLMGVLVSSIWRGGSGRGGFGGGGGGFSGGGGSFGGGGASGKW